VVSATTIEREQSTDLSHFQTANLVILSAGGNFAVVAAENASLISGNL